MSINLTNDIEQILSRLEAYKTSHPTLYNVWNEYITIQKRTIENAIIQCNNAMKTMVENYENYDSKNIRQLALKNYNDTAYGKNIRNTISSILSAKN